MEREKIQELTALLKESDELQTFLKENDTRRTVGVTAYKEVVSMGKVEYCHFFVFSKAFVSAVRELAEKRLTDIENRIKEL